MRKMSFIKSVLKKTQQNNTLRVEVKEHGEIICEW